MERSLDVIKGEVRYFNRNGIGKSRENWTNLSIGIITSPILEKEFLLRQKFGWLLLDNAIKIICLHETRQFADIIRIATS